ncbi:hypothetical protein GCM10009828_084390 [Actinoplanes couchii]|uniref:Uncharacterized protein n=1 Tax=Actinoplanes couchii TaxID=403638 RepID=A0ABQ3XNL0_9ACTN|nr:hypothetical protein Aco03nite_085040 [Actinoplanes couchii]
MPRRWCDAFGDRADEARATVERLSADGGEVRAFSFSAYNNGTAWLVARNGVTVRRYSIFDPQDTAGDPLPIEQDWMAAICRLAGTKSRRRNRPGCSWPDVGRRRSRVASG